jgi:hypothetical protein
MRAVVGAAWRVAGAAGAAFVTPTPPVTLGRPSRAWLVVAGLAFVVSLIAFVHSIDRTAIGPWRFSVRDPFRPVIIACVAAAWFVRRRWRLLPRVRPAIAAAAAATGAPATGGAGAPGSAPIDPTAIASTAIATTIAFQRRVIGDLLIAIPSGSINCGSVLETELCRASAHVPVCCPASLRAKVAELADAPA